jgi:hypothetical protein
MVKVSIDIFLLTESEQENLLNLFTENIDSYEYSNISKNDDDIEEVKLIPFYGSYDCIIDSVNYKIKYCTEGDYLAIGPTIDKKRILEIECNHYEDNQKNLNSLKNLILKMRTTQNKKLKNFFRIFTSINNFWSKNYCKRKRLLNTIFLDKKDKIINDLIKFLNEENIYIEKGFTYKRNYLLYGPPGTGKTSLIQCIASNFDLDIYNVNFSSNINDSIFIDLISKLPNNALLVLEDIDRLLNIDNASITFSTILNCLDGFSCKHRLLTFITTNHKEKLDKAFLRPGRIDFIMELSYGKKNQLKKMYESYFNNNDFNIIYGSLKSKKITTAAFHKFLFEKRDSPNLINEIDFLNNLIECDDKISNLYI